MTFTKGKTGNPNGRPPGKRAFTELLSSAGDEVVVIGGEELTAKEVLARRVWHFVMTGEVELSGEVLKCDDVKEWATAVRWLYAQIDGAPRTFDGAGDMVVEVRRLGDGGDLAS